MRITQARTIVEDLYLTDDTIYKITLYNLRKLLDDENVLESYQLHDAIYKVFDALAKKREKND